MCVCSMVTFKCMCVTWCTCHVASYLIIIGGLDRRLSINIVYTRIYTRIWLNDVAKFKVNVTESLVFCGHNLCCVWIKFL